MKVLITGAAGFIGSNAAGRHLARGDEVIAVDNLSRRDVTKNLDWLRGQGLDHFVQLDLRSFSDVSQLLATHRDVNLILHLAGQTAVTTSISDPRADFDANALGTLNLLEAVRTAGIHAPLIYASTNKVYGQMEGAEVVERDGRYTYAHLPQGVAETQGLDFHSPYGCSKGAADQYVRDYHRIYGLPTVVFRQSCIYGPRQFGAEDQGWVAWFMIASSRNQSIVLYGDGKQVRDILWIGDLLDAFDAAVRRIHNTAGQIYNIGGGPANTLSLIDLLSFLEGEQGRPVVYRSEEWRAGDQRVYVSDIRKARADLGWAPRVNWERGLGLLHQWVTSNGGLF